MNTLIFVEGPNDKGFIQSLLNKKKIGTDGVIKIISMGGINNFNASLSSNSADILNKNILQIGIVIDVDGNTYQEKIDFINEEFKKLELFKNSTIDISLKSSIKLEKNRVVNIEVFLMQDSSGKGELINLLNEIKLNKSDTADCIINCISQKEESAKILSDDWLHFYLKWDSSSKKERELSNEIGLNKPRTQERLEHIFDFESKSVAFQNLIIFLEKFKQ